MFSFQRGTRGDHLDTGEIPGRPEAFLWLSPVSPRKTREDDGLEVANRLIQFHGIRHQR